jgi:hypothetical protein
LKNNPEKFAEIEAKIRDAKGVKGGVVVAHDVEDDIEL